MWRGPRTKPKDPLKNENWILLQRNDPLRTWVCLTMDLCMRYIEGIFIRLYTEKFQKIFKNLRKIRNMILQYQWLRSDPQISSNTKLPNYQELSKNMLKGHSFEEFGLYFGEIFIFTILLKKTVYLWVVEHCSGIPLHFFKTTCWHQPWPSC